MIPTQEGLVQSGDQKRPGKTYVKPIESLQTMYDIRCGSAGFDGFDEAGKADEDVKEAEGDEQRSRCAHKKYPCISLSKRMKEGLGIYAKRTIGTKERTNCAQVSTYDECNGG